MLNVVLPTIFVLVVLPILILLYGITRWQSETVAIRDRLEATRVRLTVRTFNPDEIVGLPPPVQRFFQTVLTPGQPLIAVAEIGHKGKFNLDRSRERWMPFSSTQVVNTQRPGFDWDARIRKGPGMQVFVHDAYISGAGFLKAALFGLVRVADQRDSAKLTQGDLMRFLAEAVWYPTKLLPSQGVQWQPIDDRSALATFADGENQVSLTFVFDDSGMVRSVSAPNRWRVEKKTMVERPWEGRFWGSEMRGGMRIPVHGEAAWLLPRKRLPYWRGDLTEVLYKFAA